MPENLARLLYIVRTLLGFARRVPAIIERRAAEHNFWLFSAVFGTSKLPVILAHIHRGILRAAALETLLLARAATGRDVAAPPRPQRPVPAGHPSLHPADEPFQDQVARLTAERARHDAPADPHNLATPEAIEAEVRARPISRTIDDIRRDLGMVAMMCTNEFWDALADAIACHQDAAAAESLDATPPKPDLPPPPPQADPSPKPTDRNPDPDSRQTPARKIAPRPIAAFRVTPARPRPRRIVPLPHKHAPAPAATGPPPRAATLSVA